MLKARCNNGMFILGLEAENVKLLMEGKPIVLSLADLGGTDDILIMYGDTVEDMKRELAQFGPLPKPKPVKRGH